MFTKTIAALKGVEGALQDELSSLYDEKIQGYWHAAGSSILLNAQKGVIDLREELERRQALVEDQAALVADNEAKAEAAPRGPVTLAGTAPTVPTAAPEASPAETTPQAQALAEEAGIDLAQVKGSGEGGKITKADVEAALPPNATEAAAAHAAEVGVDLRDIKGTGADGKITKADVEAAVAAKESASA